MKNKFMCFQVFGNSDNSSKFYWFQQNLSWWNNFKISSINICFFWFGLCVYCFWFDLICGDRKSYSNWCLYFYACNCVSKFDGLNDRSIIEKKKFWPSVFVLTNCTWKLCKNTKNTSLFMSCQGHSMQQI